MKIENKNSGEVITDFPSYGKYEYSRYGYILVTFDLRVLFFLLDYDSNVTYEDVTDSYTLYP